MTVSEQPVFRYDFNSPYAYLATTRVDALLPVEPRWQPSHSLSSFARTTAAPGPLTKRSGAAERNLVHGLGLTQLDDLLSVAEQVGLDHETLSNGLAAGHVKSRLTQATESAIADGVVGVPTVLVAGGRY